MKFLILLLVGFGVVQASASKKIKVHGHRGARAIRPENTLTAFSYALEVGVDVLELDLAVTKDDRIVISHDPYIDPQICLDQNGEKLPQPIMIRDLTLAQVKTYDCGTLKNPRFPNQTPSPGEKIPTLEELFTMVSQSKLSAAKTVEFNIETKIFPSRPELSPPPKKFAQLVLTILKKFKMEKRTILQSFDYRTLVAMKELSKKVRTSQLTYENLTDFVAIAKSIRADIISPNEHWIDKDSVTKLHAAGVQVAPWTANEKQSWDYLIDANVDAIITDDPAALIEYLKSRKLR